MGPIRAILVARAGLAAVVAVATRRLGARRPSPAPSPQAVKSKHVTRVTLRDSAYGKVLFDKTGQALYLFTADAARRSNCSGECAAAWPPFHARGRLAAGAGVNRKRLGSIKRDDGTRQVTYAGHPLYFYVHDPKNEILCHDVTEFGGDWLVVRASGKPAP